MDESYQYRTGISHINQLCLADVTKVLLDDDIKYTTIVTNIGKSLELQCDIRGAEHIIWKRNDADLSKIADDSISVSMMTV
jgi:hypothetical protein